MAKVSNWETYFIGNLAFLGNSSMAWEIIYRENHNHLGESWGDTKSKVEDDMGYYLNILPQELKEWAEEQITEQHGEWENIQMAYTSIYNLGGYLLLNKIINPHNWTEEQQDKISEYIGWTWHLLYLEK